MEGVRPSDESIFKKETLWKPVSGMRCIVPPLFMFTAADPVPVRRPVDNVPLSSLGFGVGATGKTKMGLYLYYVYQCSVR